MGRGAAFLGICAFSTLVAGGCGGRSGDQRRIDGSPGSAVDATTDAPAYDAGEITEGAASDGAGIDGAGIDDAGIDDAGIEATSTDASPDDTGSDVTSVYAPEGAAPVNPDPEAGAVTTPSGLALTTTRWGHSATLLGNGHVLLCGGQAGLSAALHSCDDFDPSTNAITAGPSMVVARLGHVAMLLPAGQVLVAGGALGSDGSLQSAEIYDPISGSFALVSSPMAQARVAPGAVLGSGPNAGKVFLVGGSPATDSAEVFDPGNDPVSGTFTLLPAHMSVARSFLTAAGLPGGGLLVAGGGNDQDPYLSSAETLDPTLSAFASTSNPMSNGRQLAQSVTLPDGRIFVFDGYAGSGGAASIGNGRADIYDPATRTFTATAALPTPRNGAAIAVLKSGRVMIAGGESAASASVNEGLGDVLVYDPSTDTFLTAAGTLSVPRTDATATTLNDGRVLIAGGFIVAEGGSAALDIFTE